MGSVCRFAIAQKGMIVDRPTGTLSGQGEQRELWTVEAGSSTPSVAPSGTSHSMMRSARCTIDDGTVIPNSFATLRLTTSSNVVGCSTGSSLGLAPFSSLST